MADGVAQNYAVLAEVVSFTTERSGLFTEGPRSGSPTSSSPAHQPVCIVKPRVP